VHTRRRFLQRSVLLAALAALEPFWLGASRAGDELLRRRVPSSGEELPAIGLGTARTFDVPLDDAALAPLLEVLRLFVESGARVMDTAPSYGNAERVTGELVRRLGARERVFLASKVSSTGAQSGRRQIEASFRALRTERIDLLQVHNLQDVATQLALLRELKEQGRLRYLGVTHYVAAAHDDLLDLLRRETVDFVQFNYSVGERDAERRLLPFCADNGIATLINRPFMRGRLLAGVRGRPLPELARELGASSWAQLLLKYILAEPAVTAVLPATANPRHMVDNLLAGLGRLPDARQRALIAALFA